MIFLIPVVLFFALIYDPENIQSVSIAERFSPIAFLLIGGIILPLIEEVAFRLSLIFKPIYFSLSFSALSYYFLTKAIFHTKISMVDESFATRISIAVSLGLIIFLILNIHSFSAIIYGYTRVSFGFIFPLTLHIVTNLIAVSLSLLSFSD